jgi:hypothetical protein
MTPKELNSRLITAFPELEKEYKEIVDYWEDEEPGSHVIYGDVLVPRLEFLIQGGQFVKVKNFFGFLESLLIEGDEDAVDVVWVTVVEDLFFSEVDRNHVEPLLPPEMHKIWKSYLSTD